MTIELQAALVELVREAVKALRTYRDESHARIQMIEAATRLSEKSIEKLNALDK